MKGRGAGLAGTCGEPVALEHALVPRGLETQRAQLVDSGVEFGAIEPAGRCDDGDAVAGREGSGLAELAAHAKRAISAATAWCSSDPSRWRTASSDGTKRLAAASLPSPR